MKYNNRFSNKKGFSLIELSIVILIIGVIIAGITQSSRLVELYRLSAGRTQTQSSPVNAIDGLVVWYDATSEESFEDKETDDHDSLSSTEQGLFKGRISVWYDISSSTGERNNASQDNVDKSFRPKYKADCINRLPCVDFDGTKEFLSFDGSKLASVSGENYTIFLVEKPNNITASASETIIGSSATGSETLTIGYSNGAGSPVLKTVQWGHASGQNGDIASSASGVDYHDRNPVLHVFVNESKGTAASLFNTTSVDGNFYYYANGDRIASVIAGGVSGNAGPFANYNDATIGKGYKGSTEAFYEGGIGEIIIFNKALKSQERDAIESYLIKKWYIKPDRSN